MTIDCNGNKSRTITFFKNLEKQKKNGKKNYDIDTLSDKKIAREMTWTCWRGRNLKRETESLQKIMP